MTDTTQSRETPNSSPPEYPNTKHLNTDSRERRWALWVALLTMLLTLVPYLIGWMGAQGRQFMWLGYNLDDSCVYLSWMRQAAGGSFRALNLFTTDAQSGTLLNPLFLALGWIARLTHLPLLAVYHLARLGFGVILIMVVWEFLRTTISQPSVRRWALLCVCFASGLGWLPLPWEAFPTSGTPAGPIDFWQPEAITFLSLLLSPLFCFSLALQIGALLLLFKGEQTGRMRYAVGAGLCGFVLGLTHTYDVLSVGAVWIVYLCCSLLSNLQSAKISADNVAGEAAIRTNPAMRTLLQALVAGVCTAPAVAYIYYQLQTEATFLKRANVVTASALPLWVIMGYGLTLALAIYGVYQALKQAKIHNQIHAIEETATPATPSPATISSDAKNPPALSKAALRLLAVWAVINILVSYLPVSKFPFQRKMLQGAHFPIAILAGCGLACLLTHPAFRRQIRSVNLVAGIILLVLALTNARFVVRELTNYQNNRAQSGQRPYLNPGELEALRWIETNTPAGTAIQPLPWVLRIGEHRLAPADMTLACFTPGLIHRSVYCGHWGETPDYGDKLQKLIRITNPAVPDEIRAQLLKEMRVQYVVFSQKHLTQDTNFPFHPVLSDPISVPPYLELVHSNEDADVYKVNFAQ